MEESPFSTDLRKHFKMDNFEINLEAKFKNTENRLNQVTQQVEEELDRLSNESRHLENPSEILQRLSQIKQDYAGVAQEAKEIQEAQLEAAKFFREQLLMLTQVASKLQQNTDLEPEDCHELQEIAQILNVSPNNSSEHCIDKPHSSTDTCIAETPSYARIENVYAKRKKSTECLALEEAEFLLVDMAIREKAKLTEVNQAYITLWHHINEHPNNNPLSRQEMFHIGLKVAGRSEQVKLKVLKALKLIDINRNGDVTFL